MNFAAETSLGVVTVRAFNMVDRFFKSYLKLVDTDATLFFHSNAAMEWIILRIEALQNLTVVTAALLLILLPQGYVSPGNHRSINYYIRKIGSGTHVTPCFFISHPNYFFIVYVRKISIFYTVGSIS